VQPTLFVGKCIVTNISSVIDRSCKNFYWCFIVTQSSSVTDGWTDRQADRIAIASIALREKIAACS